MRWSMVAAGGVVGTLARWGIGKALPAAPADFPWATLLVNVSGAFALGLLGVALIERMAHVGHLRTFLGIGLIGSYTTFSAMALEGVRIIEDGRVMLALTYWVATLVFGQMAGVYGMWIARMELPRGRRRDDARR